jgi:hypothetical protein
VFEEFLVTVFKLAVRICALIKKSIWKRKTMIAKFKEVKIPREISNSNPGLGVAYTRIMGIEIPLRMNYNFKKKGVYHV